MDTINRNSGGFMDEIRCDESDYLIWKWHPRGSVAGVNTRENAIRWGSSLRVRDGSVAVFVYSNDNGGAQDFIEGPADQTLDTKNLPVLASIVGAAYAGGTPFQAEVYFINLAQVIQVRFAVPFFDVYDPRFLDFGVPVAVRGSVTFHISDYHAFIAAHRLDVFDLEMFKRQLKGVVIRYVKTVVANAPADYSVPVVQIERCIAEVNERVQAELCVRLARDFAVDVSGVDISAIEPDKTSEGYARLAAVTRDIQEQTVQAQAAMNIKNLEDSQRINAQNMEETLRIQREEGQYAQRKATQSQNFAAYQLETQGAMGMAGAQALGQMGSGGSLGSGGGFNPAAMIAGVAMGGAVGRNMANMMDGMTGAVADATPGTVPPPVPVAAYYVAVGAQPTGPYDMATLRHMSSSGAFTRDALVWREGMGTWEKAGTRTDLIQLFGTTPPPVPGAAVPPVPNGAANDDPSGNQGNQASMSTDV